MNNAVSHTTGGIHECRFRTAKNFSQKFKGRGFRPKESKPPRYFAHQLGAGRGNGVGGARTDQRRRPGQARAGRDPYERADVTSNTYYDWALTRAYILVPAQAYVGKFLKTFEQFPPRQKPASFSVGGQMEELEKALARLNADID